MNNSFTPSQLKAINAVPNGIINLYKAFNFDPYITTSNVRKGLTGEMVATYTIIDRSRSLISQRLASKGTWRIVVGKNGKVTIQSAPHYFTVQLDRNIGKNRKPNPARQLTLKGI